MNNFTQWLNERFPLALRAKSYLSHYHVPKNLNFFYVFGFLALLVLVNQLITGLWLTMFYTPTAEQAFNSIEYIMRDVSYGWLFRYMHSTGASAFFIVIYLHMFRSLLYGSYQKPRELVWLLGMLLFLLLIAEAFFGYLLPWGQMSYWGAQVVTSLCSAIPWIGDSLANWIRGDYLVSNTTLQRFFALHVIAIPFLIILVSGLHIVALHQVGSNNPEGIDIKKHVDHQGKPLDAIPFHPYFTLKESVSALIFLIGFFAIVFFFPTMGGFFLEQDNFTPANPVLTPDHIAPMWYLRPFYTLLKVIPDKLAGIIAMASSILILFFLPWLDKSPVRSMRYKGVLSRIALAAFVVSFLVLTFLGTATMTPLTQWVARGFVLVYFAYFILMPFYSYIEGYQEPPERLGL